MSTKPAGFPVARQRPLRRLGWLWVLPLLVASVLVGLLLQSWIQRGELIQIRFQHGHGLKAGDAVRYRGIPVGEVEHLRLHDDLSAIQVSVRLQHHARGIAREGSQFWIERARVDLDGARGLETLVGANYIALIPGSGKPANHFQGLEEAPLMALAETGGLEILLTSSGRGNLRAGAPVSYRQVIIGNILSVDLAADASSVVARAYIQPRYTSLIRQQTRFWRTSAAHISAGFDGLSLDLESIRGLLLGGITLATPANGGPPAAQQSRFRLYDAPEHDWLQWLPYLELDQRQSSMQQPQPVNARLYWRVRNLGTLYWPVDKQKHGWLLPVEQGLLGPLDLLQAPADASQEHTRLLLDDTPLPLPGERIITPDIGLLAVTTDHTPWPATRILAIEQPQDLLIVGDPEIPARFIASTNIRVQEQKWYLSEDIPFDPDWHGAVVITAADRMLTGFLLIDAQGARIARLPASFPGK